VPDGSKTVLEMAIAIAGATAKSLGKTSGGAKWLWDGFNLASQQVFVHIEHGVAGDLWPSISEHSALSGQWPSSHEFRPHVDVRTHMEVNESPHAGGRKTVACVRR
jgi:hypothetical protein